MDKTDSNEKLRGKGSVDRISALPDEIILVILSLLSLPEAAATRLLSHRWSDLWKHNPNLDFFVEDAIRPSDIPQVHHRSWNVEKCKYVKIVNSVIQSHKALPLNRFRIRFYVNESAQDTVTKWLQFVVSRKVVDLELKFQCNKPLDMVVLKYSLREISLFGFESLRRLVLTYVVVNGEDISLFLLSCPLLREFSIRFSVLVSDVNVCGPALALETLDIRHSYVVRDTRIRISAPNLTHVWIEAMSRETLWFDHVPKLVRAYFILGDQAFRVHHFASVVSSISSQLKILNLTLYHHPQLLVSEFPTMPHLEKLFITDKGVHEHGGLLLVTYLIWASPRLEQFRLEFLGELKDPTSHIDINIERSPHQHLKKFKYKGPCVRDPIIELVTYISNNCVTLREIILGPPILSKTKVETDRNSLRKQLRDKLSNHINLRFLFPKL